MGRCFVSRGAFAFLLAVVASVVVAGSIEAKPTNVKFLTAPARAYQGKTAAVAVKATGYGCKLSVRYADGEKQTDLFPTQVANGKATWQWQVPDFAAPGQARLTVACKGQGTATKKVIVVGSLIPPKITVAKQGFSTRIRGSSEDVSYGIVLQNTSPNGNALGVTVLVNFVMPDDHLIGTASTQVSIINAGSTYFLGGNIGFQGVPAISRLEVVIDPGGRAKTQKSITPALENVQLVPNDFDPGWLGYVQGDLINVNPTLALTNSQMSCVIFDSAGNVVGGGTGGGNFTLLPGTRSFFKLSSGFDPIPFSRAASVSISIIPSYEQSAAP